VPSYLRTMLLSYVFTIAVETCVLLVGLSRCHPIRRRVAAGVWLSACTYPILWLVLPVFISPETQRPLFLAVGETFVPLAECALFYWAFQRRRELSRAQRWRDWLVIIIANLASFGLGELLPPL
jgi:hypothetical protein